MSYYYSTDKFYRDSHVIRYIYTVSDAISYVILYNIYYIVLNRVNYYCSNYYYELVFIIYLFIIINTTNYYFTKKSHTYR